MGSKAKPDKKRNKRDDHDHNDHNAKLCFRCRLIAVMEELYPNGLNGEDNAMAVLFSMTELAGMILAQIEEDDFKQFMIWVLKWRTAARRGMLEEGIGETRH